MKLAICSGWQASVITGNCGNGFTADVLKAHLTIINSELDVAPCSDLLQAMCGKLLLKTSGRPVLTEIDSKLPLSGPRKQLVELLCLGQWFCPRCTLQAVPSSLRKKNCEWARIRNSEGMAVLRASVGRASCVEDDA